MLLKVIEGDRLPMSIRTKKRHAANPHDCWIEFSDQVRRSILIR
jgi:hypothetical protein